MPPFSDIEGQLTSALAESKRLVKARPNCIDTAAEAQALVLLHYLFLQGQLPEKGMIEGCLKRMRIAVESGVYPKELLSAANA